MRTAIHGSWWTYGRSLAIAVPGDECCPHLPICINKTKTRSWKRLGTGCLEATLLTNQHVRKLWREHQLQTAFDEMNGKHVLQIFQQTRHRRQCIVFLFNRSPEAVIVLRTVFGQQFFAIGIVEMTSRYFEDVECRKLETHELQHFGFDRFGTGIINRVRHDDQHRLQNVQFGQQSSVPGIVANLTEVQRWLGQAKIANVYQFSKMFEVTLTQIRYFSCDIYPFDVHRR